MSENKEENKRPSLHEVIFKEIEERVKIWEDGKVSQGELNIFIDRLLTLIKADHSKRHLERIIEMCDMVLGKLGSRYEWYRNKIEEIKHEFQGRLNSLE